MRSPAQRGVGASETGRETCREHAAPARPLLPVTPPAALREGQAGRAAATTPAPRSQHTADGSGDPWALSERPRDRAPHSPTVPALPGSPLRTARERQDPEHVGEGAAVGGLGDEAALAAEEEEEGDADADGGDGVAGHEAHVLLDVGDAAQRDDGAQVNAPVKPVKEPSRGLWTAVLNLQQWRGRWKMVS